ncbi:MAG: hypothetical protein ABEH35_09430 [Haloarculaceae archaeon]
MDVIASLTGRPRALARIVREMTLTPDDDPVHSRVLVTLSADGLATPARDDTTPSVTARYEPPFFEAFDAPEEPVYAVLGTRPTLDWLGWFPDGEVTVHFRGEESIAHAAEIRGAGYRAEVGPLPTDVAVRGLDGDAATDVDALVPDDGTETTRVETDAAALERLADAAAIVRDDGVPVIVEDGAFRLSVEGELMRSDGRLPGDVTGPDCENLYGDGLAAVARTLTGPVTLQIVPNGPMTVTQETEHATRRYLLRQTM